MEHMYFSKFHLPLRVFSNDHLLISTSGLSECRLWIVFAHHLPFLRISVFCIAAFRQLVRWVLELNSCRQIARNVKCHWENACLYVLFEFSASFNETRAFNLKLLHDYTPWTYRMLLRRSTYNVLLVSQYWDNPHSQSNDYSGTTLMTAPIKGLMAHQILIFAVACYILHVYNVQVIGL